MSFVLTKKLISYLINPQLQTTSLKMNRRLYPLLLLAILLQSCTEEKSFDLIINHADLLEVKSGRISKNVTLGISDGRIEEILPSAKNTIAEKTINANGKLVTPSFIDTHVHPISEFANEDYDLVPRVFPEDSLLYYRKKLSDGFLPFGTTTILMMGHPDLWTPAFMDWTNNSASNYIDAYTCGGALVTMDENRYKGHYRLSSAKEAKEKVQSYYDLGLRHIKMYWRLKEPEFSAVYNTADSLGMTLFAHIGGYQDHTQLNIPYGVQKGVIHHEHLPNLPTSIFTTQEDWEAFNTHSEAILGKVTTEPLLLISFLEMFRYVEENKKVEFDEMIQQLADANGSISTTIGFIYKQFEKTFFSEPEAFDDNQIKRSKENFKIFMAAVKTIHDKGVDIRIGTDTKDGGKVLLLELMLFCEYGFSVEEAFKIGTINGARAMKMDHEIGSLEKGKKANLIIWEKSPFDDATHFSAEKIVIKDGVVFK